MGIFTGINSVDKKFDKMELDKSGFPQIQSGIPKTAPLPPTLKIEIKFNGATIRLVDDTIYIDGGIHTKQWGNLVARIDKMVATAHSLK